MNGVIWDDMISDEREEMENRQDGGSKLDLRISKRTIIHGQMREDDTWDWREEDAPWNPHTIQRISVFFLFWNGWKRTERKGEKIGR